MKYRHRFVVRAPLSQVAEFHNRPESMAAITPPPMIVRMHRAPAAITAGEEMSFTLWVGPLPIHWTARLEDVTANGFTDRQVSGPFASWAHRHTYSALDDQTTAVNDDIELELKRHPVWWVIGLGMRLGLPFLFFYRGLMTRRLLQ